MKQSNELGSASSFSAFQKSLSRVAIISSININLLQISPVKLTGSGVFWFALPFFFFFNRKALPSDSVSLVDMGLFRLSIINYQLKQFMSFNGFVNFTYHLLSLLA